VIEAIGLGYRVGNVTLLAGVDLAVQAGEFVAVVGPNGAGKTTLLRLLAGDLRPTQGRVQMNGSQVEEYSYDQLALQRSFFSQLTEREIPFTVDAVVTMGRYPHRKNAHNSSSIDAAAVTSALVRSQTSHLTGRVFASLSSGEQTRVALARTFAQDTPLLLLDEPAANLDVANQEHITKELRNMADRGRAVLAVLDDLNSAAHYATRVVVLADGAIRADGTPAEVFQESLLSEVYRQAMRVVRHPFRDCPLVLVADR